MNFNLLNNDILTEILLHLPFRSLLRSRSVCKSWRDLIDSQPFQKSHIHQHADDGDDEHDDTLLVHFRDGVSELSMLSPHNGKLSNISPQSSLQQVLDTPPRPRFVGPANGLICIYSRDSDAPVAVCNPSLGHITILPTCSFEPNPNPNPSLGDWFIEHNHHWTIFRDFGVYFDKVSGDYAVVKLMSCLGNSFHLHALVYSKATNSWREVNSGGLSDLFVLGPIKSSNNSSLSHWLAHQNGGKEVILSFDFKKEGFRILEIFKGCRDMEIFAESDDSFLFFDCGKLQIWWSRIEGNKLHWDVMKSVGPLPFDGAVIPKALCEKGCLVLQSKNGDLVVYDTCDGKWVECNLEMKMHMVDVFGYRGSFVLP